MIHTDRFIFVHVPKTAGQAVQHALGGRAKSKAPLHTPLKIIVEDFGKAPVCVAFGVRRNPWERMVSLYRFMQQKILRPSDNFDQEAVRKMSFAQFLMDWDFWMQQDREWRHRIDTPPMQKRPQHWWLEGCDRVLEFSRLKRELRDTARQYGLSMGLLPRMNATVGGDWRGEFCKDTDSWIRHYFSVDIQAGQYRGPFE